MAVDAAEFGEGYLTAHPELEDAIRLVGLKAVLDINHAVAAVRQTDDPRVGPGFTPYLIHEVGN